ncbi:MAG: glycosyltransferase family 2 protein [Prevotella sp.]|nr:glycosyltransferase family 2 protein [Prevotella sp.]
MIKDLVSVVMLSNGRGQYGGESVRSVFGQTYQNWELLLVDDSEDEALISEMMALKEEQQKKRKDLSWRFRITQNVNRKGMGLSLNSALKEARGQWIAFLNCGDLWAPEKLERQVRFMTDNGYTFSYHQFGLMDRASRDRGVLVSGRRHIPEGEMWKCCWPGYLTVMYDASEVGQLQLESLQENNDYALWLKVSAKADCYLLEENLATMRTRWTKLGSLLRTDKIKWRYEVYHYEEDLNPISALVLTLRNGAYGLWKWLRYTKRI